MGTISRPFFCIYAAVSFYLLWMFLTFAVERQVEEHGFLALQSELWINVYSNCTGLLLCNNLCNIFIQTLSFVFQVLYFYLRNTNAFIILLEERSDKETISLWIGSNIQVCMFDELCWNIFPFSKQLLTSNIN